ncbi:alpha/beta fold hydrolase [Bradyrhizobium murdochi]|uniref:alpha/beta fold hydrolase n=1 Tax=Bradyrhizobium murdochi TaxID=1038859 RepID=UPI000426E01A|nr:alpha/beta fold hydrolase [Bradyrhizobium murdochi]
MNAQHQSIQDRSALFAGERCLKIQDVQLLAYCRPGDLKKPLVLFLTGGGIVARIAYGHPQGEASDFLDYWLDKRGWGLLTATYPGDHPVFAAPKPDLKLEEWASALAELVTETVGEGGKRPIIACGWSMGGKLVFALSRALRLRGHALECFVSFCATPPFPRIDGGLTPPESLLSNGLWNLSAGKRDGSTRDERWLEELFAIAGLEGRSIIEPEAFRNLYRTNAPPGLWGPELDPYFEGEQPQDLSRALRAARVFSGDDYPICAAIVPLDARDYRHALADEAIWGGITVKGLLHTVMPKLASSQLPTHDWVRLRACVLDAPRRLTRHLPGGHFFFLGARGARATVAHLIELRDEVQRLEAFFGTLNCTGSSS